MGLLGEGLVMDGKVQKTISFIISIIWAVLPEINVMDGLSTENKSKPKVTV